MLTWLSVIVGIALLLVTIRDIFLTVLTSTGRGPISRWLMGTVWWLAGPVVRRWNPYREVIGPLVFIGVFMTWTVLIVVGWALIYWPFLPGDFLVDFGLELERESTSNFLASLYFSLVVLVTLGFGDIVPTDPWLRLIVPLEGMLGFGLITAAISWFLSIDPAVSRRRRLAHQIALVREADQAMTGHWDHEAAVGLMDSFATQLIQVRSDQVQFPIIYYFRDTEPHAQLANNLEFLVRLAVWADEEYGEEGNRIDLQQHMLRRAIDDYVLAVARHFIDSDIDDPERALEALIEDHR